MTTIEYGADALVYGADTLEYGEATVFPVSSLTHVLLYDGETEYVITDEVYAVSVKRGRDRELDEFNAGHATIRLHNQSGNFNPYFSEAAEYLLLESDDFLLLENGDKFLLESGAAVSGDYGMMAPGRRIVIKDGGPQVSIFDGLVEDFDYEWQPGRFADVAILAVDGLAMYAKQSFEEWTTVGGQLSGERIADLLNRPEVDNSWASVISYVDDGESTLAENTIPVGANVLTELQLVAKCEQGRFFISRSNEVRFDSRNNLTGSTVADFRDDGTGIPFSGLKVTFGSELLFTTVTVQNEGGTAQTVTDATAKAAYKDRRLTLTGMILPSDEDAEDMANYLLSRYKDPEAWVSEITVPLNILSETERQTIAGIDIGDVVTMNWTPTAGLGPVAQTLMVEGVGYERAIDEVTAMTFQLSQAINGTPFILDSAEFGVLNQNRLGW
jgi:hypothetical protein